MKNRGLAILFGLIPGAGHMYLGKMKRGMTLMLLFFADIAIPAVLGMGILALGLPIIWFYAFFDNLNLSALNNEKLESAPDDFLFGIVDGFKPRESHLFQQKNVLLGGSCIAVGLLILYNTFLSTLIGWLDIAWLRELYNRAPQFFLAIAIIILGVHFMKGGKKTADELTPYQK